MGMPDSIDAIDIPMAKLDLPSIVQTVRTYTRDFAELNRLIAGVESSNRQIVFAIADTLDDWNTTPPFSQDTLDSLPSKSVFLRGVVCTLLESVGMLQTRNQISFNDSGLQVGINDKTQFIQSWLQLLRNTYEEKKQRIKIARNIETSWGGGVHSEYRFVNNFFGDW
jgi:hypothetical protein